MSLELAEKDKALLAGELGRAAKMAMSILVRMADVYRAERMLDITGAHVDSTIYVGDAGLEFRSDPVPSIYSSVRAELDRSPVSRNHACMISSFVRARPLARPQTQTLSC